MRKLLSLVVILAALIGVLPFGMGYLTKSSYLHALNSLPPNVPFKFEVSEYKVGWLRSTATISVKLTDPQLAKQLQYFMTKEHDANEPRWVIEDNIQHGPLLLSMDANAKTHWKLGRGYVYSKIVFEPETAKFLTTILGQVPTFHGVTRITLLGNFDTTLNSEPFTFSDPQKNITVKWLGVAFNGAIGSSFDSMNGILNFAGLQIQSPEVQLQLGNLVLNQDVQKNKQYDLWQGNSTITLPLLTVNADGKQFALNDLSLKATQHVEGDLSYTDVNIGLQKVSVDNDIYGPINFELALNKLDAAALAQFQKYQESLKKADNTQSPQQAEAMGKHYISILAKGATFELKSLSVKTPDGDFNVNGKLAFGTVDDVKNTILAVQKMMQSSTASVDLKIPSSLFLKITTFELMQRQSGTATDTARDAANQKAQDEVNKLLSTGMLVQDGSDYTFKASYDKGKLTVNGKDIPLPFMPAH